MSSQKHSWADDEVDDQDFPPLPQSNGAGTRSRTKGNNAPPPPPTAPSVEYVLNDPALNPSDVKADDLTPGNALQTLRALTVWADARKVGTKGPPVWWNDMSKVIKKCFKALEADATRSDPPSTAAHLDEGGGSLPRDGGSAPAGGGSLLDCGSPCLATILERLNAQHVEVMGKLASLSNSSSPTSTPSHNASTSPSARAPPAHSERQTVASPQAPSLSLAIAIADLDANSPLRKQSAPDLKLNIESQLSTSSVPHLAKTPIHSVKRDRSRLHVHAVNAAQKAALIKHPEEWLTKLDPNASIVVRKIALQADLVSTKFDPASANAIRALASSNPTVITDATNVLSVRWLHDSKRGKTPDYSSLIITVNDADLARDLIHHGICILGENSPVYVQPPTAQQCYRCQGFGHASTSCRSQLSPRPLACARCASHDHFTSQCECPAPTKCTNMRSCSHVKICCVNCRGAHKAFAANCPVKANEISKALHSHSYVSLVTELTKAPLKKSGAARA